MIEISATNLNFENYFTGDIFSDINLFRYPNKLNFGIGVGLTAPAGEITKEGF